MVSVEKCGSCPSCHKTRKLCESYNKVLTNVWLFAHARQVGRKLCSDLTESTWPEFLKELLKEDHFAFPRDIQGEAWASPARTHCLEYERQLRKDALRWCFKDVYSIANALWSGYADLPASHEALGSDVGGCKLQEQQRRRRNPTAEERGRRLQKPSQVAVFKAKGSERRFPSSHPKSVSKETNWFWCTGAGKYENGKKGKDWSTYVLVSGSKFDDLMAFGGLRHDQNPALQDC